jgi:hypothetical protein
MKMIVQSDVFDREVWPDTISVHLTGPALGAEAALTATHCELVKRDLLLRGDGAQSRTRTRPEEDTKAV